MNEHNRGSNMRVRTLSAVLLVACLLVPFASAAIPGVNTEVDTTGTPIASITTPQVSSDGVNFTIEVVLTEEAAGNGTVVLWEVQQCINTGVCYPPELLEMTENDGVWSYTIVPVLTHTYINYEIDLNYSDNTSEVFPEGGFIVGGKVWSDCWVSGTESGGEACPTDDVVAMEGDIPGPGLLIVAGGLALAAIIARRD